MIFCLHENLACRVTIMGCRRPAFAWTGSVFQDWQALITVRSRHSSFPNAGRGPVYLHESRFLQRAFAVTRRDIAKSLDDVLAIVSPNTLAFEFCILVWRQVVNNGGVDCIRARGLYKCARR